MSWDFLDREINVGDKIAYPGRKGSTMWMTLGTVKEVGEEVDGELRVERDDGKVVTLTAPQRVAILRGV